jgi:hypothetical protein
LNIEIEVDEKIEYPSLELIIATTSKDFLKLEKCINFAVSNSINKIILTKIIVPASDFLECENLLQSFNNIGNFQLINEDELICEEIRNLIKTNAKNNYGWVLQQVIKLQLALESRLQGVLIVDSDTLLLGRNLWLDNNFVQRLVTANSKHQPYFQSLKKIGVLQNRPKYSFVTHHMLMQPEIVKNLFLKNNFKNLYDFLEYTFLVKKIQNSHDLSMDYELYGQFIYFNFRNRCAPFRFCNLSLSSRSTILANSEFDFQNLNNEYNSISFHSWNQISQ